MSKYIEEASDLNVEGIEFYVKETPDGYVYLDEEFKYFVSKADLIHAFRMNDIVVIDNGVACRASNIIIDDDKATVQYISIDDGSVTGKEVKSFDVALVTDVEIAADTDLLGKVVGDLQSNVEVSDKEITGTIKYVTGYTGFSSKVEEQSGNYLAIHNTCNLEDDIYVELIGGKSGPVKLDSDGIIILRLANKNQRVKVTCGVYSKEYSLSKLILETPEDDSEE